MEGIIRVGFAQDFFGPRFIQGYRSSGVPSRSDRPLFVALVIDLGKQKIDRFAYSRILDFLVRQRVHQPLQHVTGGLDFSFLIGFVGTPFVPTGAETAIRIL